MAILGNLTSGAQDLNAVSVDTVLHSISNRTAVVAFSIFNTQASERTIDIYESPDDTSASGTRISTYTMQEGDSAIVIESIGGFSAGSRIIGVQTTGGASSGDLNAKITYTEYTDGS